jgi:hypothetical protein
MYLLEVTRLVVECSLHAEARLFNEIDAWRTVYIVGMALVVDRRMSTAGLPLALVRARRLTRTTRLWWMKNSSAAVARYLLPDGYGTALTSTTMAKLFAIMRTALQWSATSLDAYVLGFNRE